MTMADILSIFFWTGIWLGILMIVAMLRGLLGPTIGDRVVALDTINTIVVAAMVVLAMAYREIILVDIAIVYAILSYITTLYMAKYLEGVRDVD